jgi:15-cis-phytoene synthase
MSQEIVREHDHDRYLATLYAPADKQPHLFALYAFAAEIARVPRMVSEAQIGEIRLQWWAEALEALERGDTVDHPTAKALGQTGLPYAPLKAMIEARRFDLYADIMPSLADLEGYLGETEASVFQLAAMILSPEAAKGSAELCGLAGVAYGLARVLALGHPGFVPKGETRESLAARARERLGQAQALPVPLALLPAVLPVSLTVSYLQRKTTPFVQLKRQFLIWRAAKQERI